MGVREIPVSYEIKCDGCGVIETAKSKSRPAYWTGLNIIADAYDYQGCAVASANVDRLLCAKCTTVVHSAVNTAITERRQALSRSSTEVKNDG